MSTVRKLLEGKGKAGNVSVSTTDTVLNALKVMADAHIGAVLVAEDHKFVGIFTERDYLLKGELAGRTAKDTRVADVMTRSMYTVTMDTSAEQCMALMDEHHFRHLPVVENDQQLPHWPWSLTWVTAPFWRQSTSDARAFLTCSSEKRGAVFPAVLLANFRLW